MKMGKSLSPQGWIDMGSARAKMSAGKGLLHGRTATVLQIRIERLLTRAPRAGSAQSLRARVPNKGYAQVFPASAARKGSTQGLRTRAPRNKDYTERLRTWATEKSYAQGLRENSRKLL